MGGRTQTETQNQSFNNTENIDTGPWGPQQPYIERLFSEAGNLYDQGPMQYYPGQTYAGPSGASMAGIQGLMNLGNMGVQNDPLYGLASQFIGNSLGSTPQIGGIQDFLSNQLNPFSQIQAMGNPVAQGFPQQEQRQPYQAIPGLGDVARGVANNRPGFPAQPGNNPQMGPQPQGGPMQQTVQGPRNPMQQHLIPPNMGGGGMQPGPDVMNERQRILAMMAGGR